MAGDRIIVEADPDLADLIPGFLDNRRADVGAIRRALADGDFEKVRILGHSMKGAGGGYGFDGISEIGAALEAAGTDCDDGTAARETDALESYLERVEVIYE